MANNTIALQALAPQFEMPAVAQAKALQVRALQDEEQQRQRLQQQAAEDDASQRAALQGDPTGGQSYLASLAGSGNYKAFSAGQKANAELAKSGAETKHKLSQADAEHMKTINDAFTMHRNLLNTVNTPEDAAKWMEVAFKDPLVGPIVGKFGDLQSGVSKIPTDPAKFAEWKLQAGLSADQYVKYTTPDANAKLSAKSSEENSKRTAASSKYSADSTAQTAAKRLAYDKEQPRGQIVTTDSGPMLADPRAGTARPLVGPDGQPLAPKLKSLPAPIQKALLENDAALRKVDDALAAVDAYPDAFGLLNVAGDTVRQRTDPKGVKGRALVADIGSLKIHDRSGAAVTAAETPRLKPFIPSANDNPETIKEKLRLFRKEYEDIQNDINSTYTAEQGYRAPATSAKPVAARKAAPAAKNAKGWTLHTDAQGNKAYVSPDGKQFEEVK